MSGDGSERLRGRGREYEVLDGLVSEVEAGRSAVLVLRGDAGIGKSALLDHLAARVTTHRVARGAGAESEMELPFAGLHQLCAPFLGHAGSLPPPQAKALATAFGMSAGPPPDRFLVGLAVLGLLTDVAARRPLFCLVDDAQWLDRVSAQTLAFVARRMLAEPLALVFATREQRGRDDLAGLPELTLRGLDDADARALLDASAEGPMDERIRDRVLAEARGNPLALLELPHGRVDAEAVEGSAPHSPGRVTSRIERSYLARVRSLPEPTQRLLLAAAGLVITFGLQALINMAVNVQIAPSKGMTLPFISYGGSSMLALSIGMGLLLAFTRRNPYLKRSPYVVKWGGESEGLK